MAVRRRQSLIAESVKWCGGGGGSRLGEHGVWAVFVMQKSDDVAVTECSWSEERKESREREKRRRALTTFLTAEEGRLSKRRLGAPENWEQAKESQQQGRTGRGDRDLHLLRVQLEQTAWECFYMPDSDGLEHRTEHCHECTPFLRRRLHWCRDFCAGRGSEATPRWWQWFPSRSPTGATTSRMVADRVPSSYWPDC